MRKWIAMGLVSAAALTGGALWGRAQVVQPNNPRTAPNQVQPPPQIISGADFGFRVDSWGQDGTPSGKIVVRQNGQWIEVRITGAARRIDVVK